jgi:hypothetical protein
MRRVETVLLLATALALWPAGCDEGRSGADDDGSDGDSDGDSDSDSDSDSDGDSDSECVGDVPWGDIDDYTEGQPIGNWSFENGYIDSDKDGFVEEVDTPFTMLDMHCAGHQSAVLIGGSIT